MYGVNITTCGFMWVQRVTMAMVTTALIMGRMAITMPGAIGTLTNNWGATELSMSESWWSGANATISIDAISGIRGSVG